MRACVARSSAGKTVSVRKVQRYSGDRAVSAVHASTAAAKARAKELAKEAQKQAEADV